MKKFIHTAFLFSFVISFVFLGCSKNDTYKNSIPKDAFMVVSVNFKSLAEKAGLKDLKESKFYNFLKNSATSDDDKKQFIEKLISEPEISGIDFEKDAYFFRIQDKEMNCVLVKLKNYSKFQDILKDILKDKMPTIEETDDYYFITPSKKDIIAWDNEKLILISTDKRRYRDSLKIYLNEYMKGNKNNSIFNDPDFADFYKNKKDINLWITLEGVFSKDEYEESDYDKLLSSDIMKGSKFYASLDFGNGNISLSGKSIVSESFAKKFDINSIVKDGLSDNMIKAVPNNSIAYLSFAVELKKYLDLLGNIMGKNITDMPLTETMKVSTLTNMFSGEFVICLNDFSKKITTVNYTFYDNYSNESLYDTSYIPVISIYASIDTNGLNNVLNSLQIPFLKFDNYYEISTGETDRIYISIQNNIMLLTFNKDIIDRFIYAQSESDNLTNHVNFKSFKNNPSAMFINLNYEKFSEGTRGFLEKIFGDFNSIIPYIELYDSFIYEARKDNTFSASIKMRDSSKNSLYNILHNLDKNVKFN